MLLKVMLLLLSLRRSDAHDIRLVGGASACAGELQVNVSGEWSEVLIPKFVLDRAAAVCRRLDCGSVVSQKRTDRAAVMIQTDCVKSSAPIQECVEDANTISRLRYNITCSDSLRLAHGPRLCSGSLQVRSKQSWTPVCEEDFDLKAAEVVCRELGCGAPSLLQGALSGGGFAPVRQMFQCAGHESALMDCPSSSLVTNICTSGKAVELSCSEPLRLVNGSHGCAGTVELRFRGQWRPLSVDPAPDLAQKIAAEVCPLLDCGSSVSAHFLHSSAKKLVWLQFPECLRNQSHLRECIFIADHNRTAAVEVKCSGKPDHILLLWLIPATVIIITAVTVPIVYKTKKSSSNVQENTGSSQPSNPESETYANASMFEPIYQNVDLEMNDEIKP